LSTTYTSTSAAAVTVYVLDTGLRTTHAEFAGRARDGWDFIDDDAVANDCHGHGTHVAGSVGGTRYGVAKDVKLVGVRVLDCNGSGPYSAIIGGIDWITAHAAKPAVANMSLGGSADRGLDDAVKRSIAAGVTYALAAGNSNVAACGQSPARTATAITVGATDAYDARASFSNYGSCLDIFAPGVRITSAGYSSDTASAVMSGTSMASPHVAGAAALVLGAYPGHTPAQVRDALVGNAVTAKVTSPGTGSPNVLLHAGWLNPVVPAVPVPTVVPAPTTNPTVTPAPGRTPTPGPATSSCGPFLDPTDVAILDLRTATSTRTVTGCPGPASTASTVSVDIKHTHRGSLLITLVSPTGRLHTLKTISKADSTDNLVATYTFNASQSPRNGNWTLRIIDGARNDVGRLDSWTLKL
jgi:subtilisin family serine protease